MFLQHFTVSCIFQWPHNGWWDNTDIKITWRTFIDKNFWKRQLDPRQQRWWWNTIQMAMLMCFFNERQCDSDCDKEDNDKEDADSGKSILCSSAITSWLKIFITTPVTKKTMGKTIRMIGRAICCWPVGQVDVSKVTTSWISVAVPETSKIVAKIQMFAELTFIKDHSSTKSPLRWWRRWWRRRCRWQEGRCWRHWSRFASLASFAALSRTPRIGKKHNHPWHQHHHH